MVRDKRELNKTYHKLEQESRIKVLKINPEKKIIYTAAAQKKKNY